MRRSSIDTKLNFIYSTRARHQRRQSDFLPAINIDLRRSTQKFIDHNKKGFDHSNLSCQETNMFKSVDRSKRRNIKSITSGEHTIEKESKTPGGGFRKTLGNNFSFKKKFTTDIKLKENEYETSYNNTTVHSTRA